MNSEEIGDEKKNDNLIFFALIKTHTTQVQVYNYLSMINIHITQHQQTHGKKNKRIKREQFKQQANKTGSTHNQNNTKREMILISKMDCL